MKRVLVITVAAALAATAYGAWMYEGKWGESGGGNGQFDLPKGVAVAANGNVYVSDTYNHRVQYFTPTGSFLGKWGSYGTGEGYFKAPTGVTVGLDPVRLFVADTGNNRIQYFTAGGLFLGTWGSSGAAKGKFSLPSDIALSGDGGRAYVTDTGNARIQYFRWQKPPIEAASLGRVKALFR